MRFDAKRITIRRILSLTVLLDNSDTLSDENPKDCPDRDSLDRGESILDALSIVLVERIAFQRIKWKINEATNK